VCWRVCYTCCYRLGVQGHRVRRQRPVQQQVVLPRSAPKCTKRGVSLRRVGRYHWYAEDAHAEEANAGASRCGPAFGMRPALQ